MTDWSDVVARVRGLSGHRTPGHVLHAFGEADDLGALSQGFVAAGIMSAPLERAGPRELELAVRRYAAGRVRLIGRWAGARVALLSPLFEDEDRRSIRAMLRGASSGTTPDARLAGLIPTPQLPERILIELASKGDVATLVSQLAVIENPYAAALHDEASRQNPELLRLECALNRAFATRAIAAARRCDRPMEAYARGLIDVENIWTATLLPYGDSHDGAEFFLDGGENLERSDFLALLSAVTQAERDALLERVMTIPHLAAAVGGQERKEDAVLNALIAWARATSRLDPLGTGPIIQYMLELRREVRAFQHLVWSRALGVPNARADRGLRAIMGEEVSS